MSFRSSDQKSDPFDRARAPALDSVRVFVLEERGGGGRRRRKGEGGRRPSKKKKKARRGSFRWKQKKGGRKKKKVSLAFLRREINKKKHIQRVRGTQILKDQREGDRRGSAKGGARSSVFFHFFLFSLALRFACACPPFLLFSRFRFLFSHLPFPALETTCSLYRRLRERCHCPKRGRLGQREPGFERGEKERKASEKKTFERDREKKKTETVNRERKNSTCFDNKKKHPLSQPQHSLFSLFLFFSATPSPFFPPPRFTSLHLSRLRTTLLTLSLFRSTYVCPQPTNITGAPEA